MSTECLPDKECRLKKFKAAFISVFELKAPARAIGAVSCLAALAVLQSGGTSLRTKLRIHQAEVTADACYRIVVLGG